jgi:hypothetical protein
MDFFSILLPGAFLTFLLKIVAGQTQWVTDLKLPLDGTKGWVAYLVASYLLGHFAFLLGSWLDERPRCLLDRRIMFGLLNLQARARDMF